MNLGVRLAIPEGFTISPSLATISAHHGSRRSGIGPSGCSRCGGARRFFRAGLSLKVSLLLLRSVEQLVRVVAQASGQLAPHLLVLVDFGDRLLGLPLSVHAGNAGREQIE